MATKSKKKEIIAKKGTTEVLKETLNEGIKYLKTNLSILFIDLLKIKLLSTSVVVIVALIAFLFFTLMSDISSIIGSAIALISILLALLFSIAINSVQYNAVEERAKSRAVEIFAKAKENFVPAVIYSILMLAIVFVLFLPPIFLAISSGTNLTIVNVGLIILATIIFALIIFFVQFGWWELILNKRGIIGSIKKSYELVTGGNIIKTLIFDICLLVVIFGFILISQTLIYMAPFILSFFVMLDSLIGTIISTFLLLLIDIITETISGVIVLSFTYIFWKKLE